jgi:hypothetical protein
MGTERQRAIISDTGRQVVVSRHAETKRSEAFARPSKRWRRANARWQRFLNQAPAGSSQRSSVNVVLNWQAMLKKK